MATGVYNRAKRLLSLAQLDLAQANLSVLLVSSVYVFSPKHVLANINAELGGTGYMRKPLVNKVVVQDDSANLARFSADTLVWTGANFGTPDAAIIFNADTLDLVMSLDLNPKIATNGGDWTLYFNSIGLLIVQ